MTKEAKELINQMVDGYENEKKSGFFDLPMDQICNHREHKPPTHIHIPQGKGYRHVCPGCGKVTTIIPQQISL